MKRIFTFLSALSFFATALAQPTDAYLQGRMNAGRMPGASFTVVKEGKLIYHKHLGKANLSTNAPVDQFTVFMQASVSKTMIATAVMQLWERNLIDLDADVNTYLPFQVRTPSFPNTVITPRMLLTHTSAIKDEWNTMGSLYVYGDSPVSLDSFLKNYFVPTGIFYSATGNFYNYQPGTQYNYSNIGSTLAAYLVETITGDKFSHYCDTAIFKKICMNTTSFLLSGVSDTTRIARPYVYDAGNYIDAGLYGYPDYPDGQLRTTAIDLSRFMTMYMQYGIYEGTRILDSATVAYILQDQTTATTGQGIIFYSAPAGNNDVLWGHNGGEVGVNTAMYFNMQKKTGVVVMTNGDGTSASNADGMANTLYLYGIGVTPNATDTFPSCNSTAYIANANMAKATISLYPNPTDGEVNVIAPFAGEVTVSNMPGAVVYRAQLAAGMHSLNLSAQAAGIYVVRMVAANGQMAVSKLTIVE